MKNKTVNKSKTAAFMIGAIVLLLVAMLLNICIGASDLDLEGLWKALLSGPDTSAAARILWYVRLPRTAACLLAGAALAVSGAVIQKVLANNLASPGIIGINAGAGLAVAVCCAFGWFTSWAIAGFSFIGAVCATFLVVITAQKSGASKTTVVLGGVAVTAFLNAITEGIITMIPDAALASADFRAGGFSAVNSGRLIPASIIIPVVIIIIWSLANEMDVLSLGDDTAHSLGMNTATVRNLLLALAAVLAGAAVSFAGVLGFVGLIVPHMVKRFIGTESRSVIPACALSGAGFVALCDLAARMLFAPYELPAGILMSALGGPFFIWLLWKRKGKRV